MQRRELNYAGDSINIPGTGQKNICVKQKQKKKILDVSVYWKRLLRH
jgi:hypothetical protein